MLSTPSLAVESLPTIALRESLSWCLTQAQAPIVRPMSKWVEDEIVLPSGPYEGERYRHATHPASRLWFGEIDSGRWSRHAITGPQQNGKTLIGYVVPTCWHLFERAETVVIGLPNMDMANDKWTQDFKPVIEASDYRDLLPLKGEGSKGGQVKRSIQFRNGAMLRFMTGGGSDKQRAGFTSRVVAITETDGMDEAQSTSREADAIEQIEGRAGAFGRRGKRVYLECTVSIERGRIWQELKNGTDSRIVRPCPHCGDFVAPEREHLKGWQSAETEGQAAAAARFHCPSCERPWTDEERRESGHRAVLLHRGQTIDKAGTIEGELPDTETLGFRWSAIDNPFVSTGDLGAYEWKARNAADQENAEKKQRQFIWAIPYESPDIELTPLDAREVATRKSGLIHRQLPPDCIGTVVGIDTSKRHLHWTAYGIRGDGRLPIFDYGVQPVESERLGTVRGLIAALTALRAFFEKWPAQPDQVWIDSGWHEHTDAVYEFCIQANQNRALGSEVFRPTKGYGEGQARMGRYIQPAAKMQDVLYVGKEYHIARVRRNGKLLHGVLLVHMNADYWKSEVHQRLGMPPEQPGALTLWDDPDPYRHADYTAHHLAERQIEKLLPARGRVTVWERLSRANHHFDAGYAATCAADFVIAQKAKPAIAKPRLSLEQYAAISRAR